MDERFTDARVGDPGVRALFTRDRRWQGYLEVEAALALAEADLGVIPGEAATAIAAAARLDLLDTDRIVAGMARSSHPLMPLIVELSAAVGDPHGGWVHWGATTQNITQTADVLLLRQAHAIIVGLLGAALSEAGDLAEESADMVMAGRTHGQQAVPITFGFKVAVWIDALARHMQRLQQLEDRLFVAMMGGAAGTFASLGAIGPQVQAGLARRLGLGAMPVPARSLGDPFAELVCVLGMLAATGEVVAAEVFALMATEVGEVAEPAPPGVVGSSTMPHKRNPQLSQDMLTISAQIRAMVPLALEAMVQGHEGDGARTAMMDEAVTRACILAGDLLARLRMVLAGLELDGGRMRTNLGLSGGLIMSEAVMLALGAKVGRQRAHDVVQEAAGVAHAGGRTFQEILTTDPRVRDHLTDREVTALLDPLAHAGLSREIAHAAADRASTLAAEIAGTAR
jgi:adenylosuccinate lyase